MLGFERITFDPDVMGGRACVRGMHVTVSLVVNLVASGMSPFWLPSPAKSFSRSLSIPGYEAEDVSDAVDVCVTRRGWRKMPYIRWGISFTVLGMRAIHCINRSIAQPEPKFHRLWRPVGDASPYVLLPFETIIDVAPRRDDDHQPKKPTLKIERTASRRRHAAGCKLRSPWLPADLGVLV